MELCRYRMRSPAAGPAAFQGFNDQTLLSIASELPGNLEQLGKLPGMSPNQVRRHGAAAQSAAARLAAAGFSDPPAPPMRGFTDAGWRRIRTWRRTWAAEIGVAST